MNGLITKPEDPIGDTEFLYWSYNNEEFDFNTPVTRDMVLIAVFAEVKYTVSFDTVDGSVVENQEVSKTQLIKMPDNPTKEGYEFLYWSYNNKQFEFTTFISSDITLVAVWEEITDDVKYYTITFNTVGGSNVSHITVIEGSIITPPTTTQLNYTFLYWSYNNVEFDFNTRIYSDMTITAVWEMYTFVVTFDSKGGTYSPPQIINIYSTASKPTIYKNGYTFLYWELDGEEYSFSNKITSDITLVAVWEEIIYFTISYETSGSSVDSQEVVSGNSAAVPYQPTKENYVFSHWTLNGNIYNFATPITGDVTLVAVWILATEIIVTFDCTGGNDIEAQIVSNQYYVDVPTPPQKENYSFVYWMLDGVEFNFSTQVTESITLTAVWFYSQPVVTYTVTFISNNAVYKTLTAIENQYVTSFSMSDSTYYSFDKWIYTNGDEFLFSHPITSDITVYAIWNDRIYYSITYDYDGGIRTSSSTSSTVYPSSVEAGKSLYLTGTAKKDFYDFLYWELPDGSIYSNYKYYPTGDFVLKAVYEEVYNVSLDFSDSITTYNGYSYTKTIAIETSVIPTGVSVTYENNTYKEAGTYVMYAYAWYNNEIIKTATCEVVVLPKTLTLTHSGTFVYEYTGEEIESVITTSGSGWGYYHSSNVSLKGDFYHTYSNTLLNVGEYNVDVRLMRLVDGVLVDNTNYTIVNTSFTVEVISKRLYNFDYEIVDNEITITGFYNSLQTSLIVPSVIDGYKVTSIAASAFSGQTNLVTVELPSSIKKIGDSAFLGCTKLSSISFENGLESIGNYTFKGCTSLTQISLPNTTLSIGNYAFDSCTTLSNVSLGMSVETIGNYAFSSCTKLTTIDVGSSLNTIGTSAFSSCSSLNNVSLPNTLISIGSYAFSSCTSLVDINFEENLEIISSYAFQYCSSLLELKLPNSITTIGDRAFQYCSKLEKVNIPNELIDIPTRAFYLCTKLNEVVFTSNSKLKTIGVNAFYDCAISSITLPDSLTTIGTSAFYRNTELTSIVIPNNVTSFGSSIFSTCTGLTTYTLPDGIKTIPSSMFSSCTGLTTIVIPASVEVISSSAFSGCSNVTYINMLSSNTITTLGDSAFSDISKITNFTIPITVTSIGGSAFKNWYALESIAFPAATKTIGTSAFSGCTSLQIVVIPETVTSIGTSLFSGCTNLVTATIHSNITKIPDSTFSNCTSLTNAIFTSTITEIGSYAFYYCKSLKSFSFSSDIKTIGASAFRYCTGLTTVILRSHITTVGSYAFRDLSADVTIYVYWDNTSRPTSWSSNWVYDSRNIEYSFNG